MIPQTPPKRHDHWVCSRGNAIAWDCCRCYVHTSCAIIRDVKPVAPSDFHIDMGLSGVRGIRLKPRIIKPS